MTVSNCPASSNSHQSLQVALNPLPKIGRLYSIIVAVMSSYAGISYGLSVPNLREKKVSSVLEQDKSSNQFIKNFNSKNSSTEKNSVQKVNNQTANNHRSLEMVGFPKERGINAVIENCQFDSEEYSAVQDDATAINCTFKGHTNVEPKAKAINSNFNGPYTVLESNSNTVNSSFGGDAKLGNFGIVKNISVRGPFSAVPSGIEVFIENQELVFEGLLTFQSSNIKFNEIAKDFLDKYSVVSEDGLIRNFPYNVQEYDTQYTFTPITAFYPPIPTPSTTPAPIAQTPAPTNLTKAPTSIPTAQPTVISTPAPTIKQTSKPTNVPTPLPTQNTNSPTVIPVTPQPSSTAEPTSEPKKTTQSNWDKFGQTLTGTFSAFGIVGFFTRHILSRVLLGLRYQAYRDANKLIFQKKHNNHMRTNEFQKTIDFFADPSNGHQRQVNFLEAIPFNENIDKLFAPNSTTLIRLKAYFKALENHLTNDLLTLDTKPGDFINLGLLRNSLDSVVSIMNKLVSHNDQIISEKTTVAQLIQNVLFPQLPDDNTWDQARQDAKDYTGLQKMLKITTTKLTLASIPQLIAEEQRPKSSHLHQIEVGKHRAYAHYDAIVKNYNDMKSKIATGRTVDRNFESIKSRIETSATELAREDFFQIIKFLKTFSDDPTNLSNLINHIGINPTDVNHRTYQNKLNVLSDMMTSAVLNQSPEHLQQILNIPADSAKTIRIQPPEELSSLNGFSQNNMDRLTDTLSTPNALGRASNEWDSVANFLKQP